MPQSTLEKLFQTRENKESSRTRNDPRIPENNKKIKSEIFSSRSYDHVRSQLEHSTEFYNTQTFTLKISLN